MICAHLSAHIFIKFEQCNKKNIKKCVLCMQQKYTQTIYDKEKKRKNREHIKKREKVENKRGGRKIKERKRKIKRGKKQLFK